jgi:thioredoxin
MPRVRFQFRHAAASTVTVAGDFNDWNTVTHPMQRQADGSWALEVDLPPGRHEYKFFVDGRDWWNDPEAPKVPNLWGSENSYVDVLSGGASPAVGCRAQGRAGDAGRASGDGGRNNQEETEMDLRIPATAAPVEVTDANFTAEVLEAHLPILLDCWAPWCGPCRMVAPAIEDLAAAWAGAVKVAKLNVDENPQTAARLGIQSIPALLLFRDGQVIGEMIGAAPRSRIEATVLRRLREQ